MSEASSTKSRATTLQQRFGFQDPELTTPTHDAIMLWLDAEMDSIITARYIDTEPLKWAEQGAKLRARALRKMEADTDFPLVPEWPGITVSKVWEQPVMNGKFMVGFIDMAVLADTPYLCLHNRSNKNPRDPWEFCVEQWKRDPMGNGAPVWTTRRVQAGSFLFEVKPSISSLGEVIRQIRMYEAYEEYSSTFLVVSPDNRFESPLEAQGIGFVQCPSF